MGRYLGRYLTVVVTWIFYLSVAVYVKGKVDEHICTYHTHVRTYVMGELFFFFARFRPDDDDILRRGESICTI